MFEHNMMHGKGLLFDSYCDGILYEGEMNRGQLISNGVRIYYFGHLFYEGDVTQNFSVKEMNTCYTTTNAFEFLWKPSPELDSNTITLSVRNDYKDLLSSMMYVPNIQGKLYYLNRQEISKLLLGINDEKEVNEVVPKSKYSQSFINIVTDISSTVPPKYYDGEFSDGMLNGIGTMYWYNKANDGKFTGQFLNDICHGNGVYLTPTAARTRDPTLRERFRERSRSRIRMESWCTKETSTMRVASMEAAFSISKTVPPSRENGNTGF